VVQGILKLENCVALEFSLDSSPQPKEQPPKKRKQKKQTIREIPR